MFGLLCRATIHSHGECECTVYSKLRVYSELCLCAEALLTSRLPSQVLQRWKDMTDTHFVPRPLPRVANSRECGAAEQVAAPAVSHADTAATRQDTQQEQQQEKQQHQLGNGRPQRSDSISRSTDTGQTAAAQGSEGSGHNLEPTAAFLDEAPTLSFLAVPRRRKPQITVLSAEYSSESDAGFGSVDNPRQHSSGLCKYFVNTGKCPRGALCPHRHEASLQQQWLRDR